MDEITAKRLIIRISVNIFVIRIITKKVIT